MKNEKQYLLKLLDERETLIEIDYNDIRIDEIKEEIITEIKKNFNQYEVDFILETYTRFGYAPCLIYDDNGLFAITGDGYQQVVTGKQKLLGNFTVFVQKKQWKKTIRLALKYYINNI
jgi:hypothetical protein